MKPEEPIVMSEEQRAMLERLRNERDEAKIAELTEQMRERFGMQEFDIEMRKY